MGNERENDVLVNTKEEYRFSPDYGELIIEMVHRIGESDDNFLKQIYTIMRRHIKKEG